MPNSELCRMDWSCPTSIAIFLQSARHSLPPGRAREFGEEDGGTCRVLQQTLAFLPSEQRSAIERSTECLLDAQSRLCRMTRNALPAIACKLVGKTTDLPATRHSSLFGINGQAQWRRSAGMVDRCSQSHRRSQDQQDRRVAALALCSN